LLRQQREAAQHDAAASDPPASASLQARGKVLENLEAELEKLRSDEGVLRLNISMVERRLEGVPERQQEYGRITRDYGAAKDMYESLLKRYNEAQLAESLEV